MNAEGLDKYPIDLVCRTLGISRSAYYNRARTPQTDKEKELGYLRRECRRLFEENNSEYGRRTLCKAMNEEGHRITESKTRELMRAEGLMPRKSRKYKQTTNSKHNHPVANNELGQEFDVKKPNTVWCGDSTYIPTDEGFVYAAALIDLCDKVCVGLSIGERHTQDLMISALDNAYREHKPAPGLLHHSDRGVQYAANDYKARLKKYGMIQSMSRSGVPYDNAPMESFWATVKIGCVHGRRFRTKNEAIKAIYEYIYGFYNTRRYHTSIGLEIPSQYRKKLLQAA